MKDFGKYVLATIVGMVVTFILFGVLGLMSMVGIIASSEATTNAPKNSVLVLNLKGSISEQAGDNMLGMLTGNSLEETGLNDILSAVKKAKENDNVKGIYIECGALAAGYATLLEVRNCLADFKKSGKWIVAYADNYMQGAYYLATVADKVYVNPSGGVDLHGIAAQSMFVKDLYAKFGVKMQVIKVGKYKSATEMYTEDHMSDANREQMTAYVNGLWKQASTDMAKSRGIALDVLNTYTDEMTMMLSTTELKAKKLIDGVFYHDQMRAEVKKLLEIEEDDDINQISIAEMRNVKESAVDGEEIAVYYASGEIVDTAIQGLGSGGQQQIVGNKMVADLEKLMNDDDVKAVVIRVNSPGGSAYASEQIWHQVTELRKKKPVVVSMGDYAASGGYYISCNADWIVAQPTTLTGSIGIFGVIPEGSELFKDKLGLKFDEVKSNRNALMGAGPLGLLSRPFNEEESALMQKYITRGYELFRKRVCDGRKQKTDYIENIAQGRVWLGSDAINIHLVDQLGGIDDAIAKAAKLANLEEYYTSEYPSAPSFFDQLLESTEAGGNYLDGQMRLMLGDFYAPFAMLKTFKEQSPIRAEMLQLIHVE